MNSINLIGNVVRQPEVRTTPNGNTVCSFSLAVNRRKKVEGQPEADFFRVTAWNDMGINCGKYLHKGKKVAVVGSVSLKSYINQKNQEHFYMEVTAKEVEFVSPIGDAPAGEEKKGYTDVSESVGDDLPF